MSPVVLAWITWPSVNQSSLWPGVRTLGSVRLWSGDCPWTLGIRVQTHPHDMDTRKEAEHRSSPQRGNWDEFPNRGPLSRGNCPLSTPCWFTAAKKHGSRYGAPYLQITHRFPDLGQMVISLNISFLICKVDRKQVSAQMSKTGKNANIIGHPSQRRWLSMVDVAKSTVSMPINLTRGFQSRLSCLPLSYFFLIYMLLCAFFFLA